MQNQNPITGEPVVFVKAIVNGIRQGGYRLIRQRQRGYHSYYASDRILGEYNYTSIRLKAKQAYSLYESLSESPLSLDKLRTELAAAELIPSSNSTTLTIAGKRCSALVIQRGNCTELNNLLLSFLL
ncbi:MAG: hypothetical protein ACI4JS_03310 [Oscillospiraceae bacterium]